MIGMGNSIRQKLVKGLTMSWSIMFMIVYLFKRKWRYLFGGLVFLAISLYEQFIHHAQINLCHNIQILSTQQRAYQSLSSYFLI